MIHQSRVNAIAATDTSETPARFSTAPRSTWLNVSKLTGVPAKVHVYAGVAKTPKPVNVV